MKLNDSVFPIGAHGSDVGSTENEIVCGICGKVHNPGVGDETEHEVFESTKYIDFCGMIIAECCFDDFEEQIIEWMPSLILWYMKQSDEQEKIASRNLEIAKTAAKQLHNRIK